MDDPKLPFGLQKTEQVANAVVQAATSQPDNSKPVWQSKTVWAAALTAVIPLIPGVGPVVSAWIAANPAMFTAALGGIFAGLRAVTKGSITIT